MDERNSAITGQILWSGFKTDVIYYIRMARKIGNSKWTLKKKIKLVSDTLFSFSTVPITVVTSIGAFSFFGSIIWAFIIFLFKIYGQIPISGWTTIIILNLITFGITMLTFGLLGGYLWRTFDASRNRPTFIIEKSKNDDKG